MDIANLQTMKRNDLDNLYEVVKNEYQRRNRIEEDRNNLFKKSKKQIESYQNRKDKFWRITVDMVQHIIDCIENNDYSIDEFINDPTVYLDSQIMGNYINNKILVKKIIGVVEAEFFPPF